MVYPNLFLSLPSFNLERIVIAVIWKQDFNKSIDINSLKKEILHENKSIVSLPNSLIKFQIPTIIKTLNPRLPFVGLCVHYTYNMPSYILNWIDYHITFGIHQLILYDATDNSILTRKISSYYGKNDRVIVKPYYMT